MRMDMRSTSFLLLSLVLVLPACGGKVAGQGDGGADGGVTNKDGGTPDSGIIVKDGGPQPVDAGKPPPPPPQCGPKNGTGYAGSDGSCGSNETWTCGAVDYEVDCQCPGAYCVCKKNGQIDGKVKYAACPSCSSMTGVAAACGYPE